MTFSVWAKTSSPPSDCMLFNTGNPGGGPDLFFWSTSLYWKGGIASFQAYNRALISSEVLQNYNAIKGRYGL